MTFRDWLDNDNYSLLLREVSRYIPEEDCGDVLHEVLLQLLETNADKEDWVSYAVRACYISYNSTTSPYARKYARNVTETELTGREYDLPDEEADELASVDILKMVADAEGVSWYEKELLKRKILEDKSFRELSDEYHLTHNQTEYSFYKAIARIRDYYKL